MKEIKGKIESIIKHIEIMSEIDKYFTFQIEITDEEKMEDFLLYLKGISEYIYIDTLKGYRRVPTNLELEDVVHKAKTSIACGIKVVRNPISKFTEWDSWEGGYIEGHARMDGFGEYPKFFTWFYIKPDKLEKILTDWENELKHF